MEDHPDITEAVEALPLGGLRDALGGVDAYLVGGVVRDVLGGLPLGPDIDIAVDADLEQLLADLDPDLPIEIEASHVRFGTATVLVEGGSVDLSRTRSEAYAAPGALPDVVPARIDADLARRDFAVNAMAVPLGSPGELLDPFGGEGDTRERILRVLHDASFVDDPTRAVRAARYAARLGLRPEERTLALLREVDLDTVSAERRRGELALLAAEAAARRGFELLGEWGVLALSPRALELIGAIDSLQAELSWLAQPGVRDRAVLLAAEDAPGRAAALSLAAAEPERPSESVRLATGHDPEVLLLAAAAGGGWIAGHLGDRRDVRLEIDGGDLIAAGIPEGPAVGAGLQGALERKLDGGLSGGRDAELELAVALARRAI